MAEDAEADQIFVLADGNVSTAAGSPATASTTLTHTTRHATPGQDLITLAWRPVVVCVKQVGQGVCCAFLEHGRKGDVALLPYRSTTARRRRNNGTWWGGCEGFSERICSVKEEEGQIKGAIEGEKADMH